MPRSRFNNSHFHGRQDWLDKIVDWVRDPFPEHRLWSVVGAPGQGKSWLLAACRERLTNNNNQCVFWLDLSYDLSREGTVRIDGLLREGREEMNVVDQRRHRWLQGAISLARAHERCGDHVRQLVSNSPFEAAVEAFVEDLCRRCEPERPPLLIFDGFDEVTGEEERKWLEERLMARFLGRDCTRLLVARRGVDNLTHNSLRWIERVYYLEDLTEEQGKKQCDKAAPGSAAILRNRFSPYTLTHAGINNELLQMKIYEGRGDPPLSVFRDVLGEIARPNELLDTDFEYLAELAEFEDVDATGAAKWWWLPHKVGVDSSAPTFERLVKFSLIHEVQVDDIAGGAFYQVADGIREFLRAYRRLRQQSEG